MRYKCYLLLQFVYYMEDVLITIIYRNTYRLAILLKIHWKLSFLGLCHQFFDQQCQTCYDIVLPIWYCYGSRDQNIMQKNSGKLFWQNLFYGKWHVYRTKGWRKVQAFPFFKIKSILKGGNEMIGFQILIAG